MTLDKQLYKRVYAQYREWNYVEQKASAKNSGSISADTHWRRYVDLADFCVRLSPKQSQWQQAAKVQAIETYYHRLARLEAWRHDNARGA